MVDSEDLEENQLVTGKHDDYGTAGIPVPSDESSASPLPSLPTHKETATMNDLIESLGFGTFQWLYLTLFGIIYMSDAAEIALSSVILTTLLCEWDLTTIEEGFIPFMVLLGYAAGSIVGGKMSDQYGRRTMLWIMLPIFVISSFLSAFAPEYWSFVFFRTIVGIAMGSNTAAVSTFALEIVPIKDRAFAMCFINIWFIVGAAYIYVSGYLFMNEYGWRVIVLIAAIPVLFACIGAFFIIESPRFLYISGNFDKMKQALEYMFRLNGKKELLPEDSVVEHREEEEGRGSLREVLEGDLFRVTILLIQVYSINAFVEYGASLLLPDMFVYDYCVTSSLFSDDSSCSLSDTEYFYLLIVSSVSVPACIVAYFTSDSYGRIKSMFGSGFIALVAMILILICINMYVLLGEAAILVFFSLLQNCAIWTFIPESYPTYVRNAAVGLVSGVGKVGAAFGCLITEVMAAYSIRMCLTLYICLTIYQLVCIYLLRRDTAGVRLADTRITSRECTPVSTPPGRQIFKPCFKLFGRASHSPPRDADSTPTAGSS